MQVVVCVGEGQREAQAAQGCGMRERGCKNLVPGKDVG